MNKAIIYIHGKGGEPSEAERYKQLFPDADVIGADYKTRYPWDAKAEFSQIFDATAATHDSISIIANSIGAYFAMNALNDKPIETAAFISPIVDMEKLISDILLWANATESELKEKREIKTSFGETLSYEYLSYAREHKPNWKIPTHVLYGGADNLTSLCTISAFCRQTGSSLTVMRDGEHWFHTETQLAFLDDWIKRLF